MVRNIIHNAVFRIFTPIFYGITMYILILLIFDSIQQLSDNFFSTEVFLCIIITYLVFEVLRILVLIIEKKCPKNCPVSYRIIIQGFSSIVIALLITSAIISFYFTKLVGFNTFTTELIVFNTIFILTAVLYNMIYFSFYYLNRVNVSQLEQESILRKNVEIELDIFKNKINSGFLYDSLETLISLSKKDTDEADGFIIKLSDVYRNILSAKNSELNAVTDEIKIARILIGIMNYKLGNNLIFTFENDPEIKSFYVISGTLVVIIEDIVNQSMISNLQPLNISCKIEDGFLKIYHPIQSRLNPVFSKTNEIKRLQAAYMHYGKQSLSVLEENNIRTYEIPIVEV